MCRLVKVKLISKSAGKYFYPSSAMRYGQSLFCGTYLTDQLPEISRQIFVSHFGIYQGFVPLDSKLEKNDTDAFLPWMRAKKLVKDKAADFTSTSDPGLYGIGRFFKRLLSA
jgi:hypothetical protein